MDEQILRVAPLCSLITTIWENGESMVCLEYVERSPAHGFSDTETSHTLEPKRIQEIIDFLTPFAASPTAPTSENDFNG